MNTEAVEGAKRASGGSHLHTLLLSGGVILASLLTLPVLFGLVPLRGISALGGQYWALGLIECLGSRDAWLSCPAASLPSGYRPGFGLPFAMVASAILRVFDLRTLAAYQLTAGLHLTMGMAGMAFIGRRLGLNWPLALAAGWLFLSLPITYGKGGYAFLMWGFVAAPLSIAADLWLLDRSLRNQALPAISAALAVLVMKCFALFSEPYSFVITSVLSLVAVLMYTADSLRGQMYRSLWRPAWIGVSSFIAVWLYKAFVHGGARYHVMDLAFFRGQGIDLISLFARHESLYLVPLPTAVSHLVPLNFYTDGEMVQHSFIGLSFLAAVIGTLFLMRDKNWPFRALTAAAAICFLFSLGPALKANSQRPSPLPQDHRITVHDYSMPKDAAVTEFPWGGLFRVVPGVNAMRAVSRWHLMFQIYASLATMILLRELYRRRRWMAIGFLSLLIAEHCPNLTHQYRLHSALGQHYETFSTRVVADLADLVELGETVVFVEPLVKTEYLSIYLCAKVGCSTYNASTDKGLAQARPQWPGEIATLLQAPTRENLQKAFATTDLDAAIVPFFDLRWNSYQWPEGSVPNAERQDLGQQLSGPQHEMERGRWFAVVRPQDGMH